MQGVWAWVMAMWRSGVAISFVLGLVVLVAELWLDDTAPVRANWRTATTMSGTGAGLSATSDPPVVTAFEAAPLQEQPRLPPAPAPSSDPGGFTALDGADEAAGGIPEAPLSLQPPEPVENGAVSAVPSAPAQDRPMLATKEAVRPADRSFPAAEPRPPAGPYSDLGPPPPRPAQVPPTTKMIAEVQHRLMALGYDLGGADGRMGYRTEAAVRDFQKSIGLRPDGRIDERLLAELDAAANARAQARQLQAPRSTPGSAAPAAEQKRGVLGSVLGGFQRLIGQDLDSVRRPAELAAYCRSNADTWIYDFGREAFVYCGNVNAESLSSAQKAGAGETASGR